MWAPTSRFTRGELVGATNWAAQYMRGQWPDIRVASHCHVRVTQPELARGVPSPFRATL